MNQQHAPLFGALQTYYHSKKYSFHVPGHKNGHIFPDMGRTIYQSVLGIDTTEIKGMDDLHDPQGAIQSAMELLSDYYGTVKSYFLVNGTTSGVLAMVMAACRNGDKVLVQRDSHKSIFNALKLARLTPVFLPPNIDEETSLPAGLSESIVNRGLEEHPDAKALILTCPNYYGFAADYRKIIETAHFNGLYVLADEAHGAHFKSGQAFPESALDMGADIVVHSAHKTLPAMTMGSYLHVQSTGIDVNKVEEYLSIFQTSSPSYPIMGSLDLARYYLAGLEDSYINDIAEQTANFKKKAGQINGIRIPQVKSSGVQADPLKVLLAPTRGSGLQLSEQLFQHGIIPELSDPRYVLLILPLGLFDMQGILEGISKAAVKLSGESPNEETKTATQQEISWLRLSYEEQEQQPTKQMPVQEALGYISAENVIPYPPGVPLVIKGESITASVIEQIIFGLNEGIYFQGNQRLHDELLNVYV